MEARAHRELCAALVPDKALEIGVEIVQQVAHDSLLVLCHPPAPHNKTHKHMVVTVVNMMPEAGIYTLKLT